MAQINAKIVLGSVLGAAFIHFALAACSGDSSSGGGFYGSGMQDPTKDAHANGGAGGTTSASGGAQPCSRWEVIRLGYSRATPTVMVTPGGKTNTGTPYSDEQAYAMPEGWEPFAGGEDLYLRRCMK